MAGSVGQATRFVRTAVKNEDKTKDTNGIHIDPNLRKL
jgi:hypothetical protein